MSDGRSRCAALMSAPLLLLATAGCGEPDLRCDADTPREQPLFRRLDASLEGALEVPAGAGETRARLSLELSDLPRVWSMPGTLEDTLAFLEATWRYAVTQPAGAEIPSLEVQLAAVGEMIDAADAQEGLVALRVCDGEETRGCCPEGSARCGAELHLIVTRSDSIFPALDVDWKVDAQTSVSSCFDHGEQPSLSLSEAAP